MMMMMMLIIITIRVPFRYGLIYTPKRASLTGNTLYGCYYVKTGV